MDKSVAAIIQARTNSSRLPQKVLADLGGRPLISFLIERVKLCKNIDEIYLATTNLKSDDKLEELAKIAGIKCLRGSENDVLTRFAMVLDQCDSNVFIRLTGDCPLLDPYLIDNAIKLFFSKKEVQYLSNISPPTFPDGLDFEIFNRCALIQASKSCLDINQREHVTPWMRNSGKLKTWNFENNIDLSNKRWCVDEPEDLRLIQNIVNFFKGDCSFTWLNVLDYEVKNPSIFAINLKFKRNEGSKINAGQKLWKRAKKVIPGGNMLLSKRPEMFLPNNWPAYFKKSKACFVWDLEDKKYIDMSIMGIGTNILGYGNDEVDTVVRNVVEQGNMSTLNCAEEVLLAEKLIDLNPWADMVRFARTGGEANAISIRIARAFTGTDKIARCGYHGWHDWYLATNIEDDSNLDQHLLSGLEPKGVPKALAGSVIPFRYNSISQVEEIFKKHDLAAIKMEVERNAPPEEGYLERIRELCTKYSVVLIFDECTSGFRETFGGIHKKYDVYPDISIYGKALGNGYAITAVVGIEKVMQAAQNSFISSTFWTERIGPSAALKTLEVMEKNKSWEIITDKGNYIRSGWEKLAMKFNLQIECSGIPALSTFRFKSQKALEYKTIFTQEMLSKGYLASCIFYPSIEHTKDILDNYLNDAEEVFSLLKDCEDGLSIKEVLRGPVCHNGFQRLN